MKKGSRQRRSTEKGECALLVDWSAGEPTRAWIDLWSRILSDLLVDPGLASKETNQRLSIDLDDPPTGGKGRSRRTGTTDKKR
jgi:hypothetical protein